MNFVLRRRLPLVQYGAAAVFGSVLALFVSRALTLEFRYVAAIILGVALLSAAMVLVTRLRDILLYLLAFHLPFTTIEKTFFLSSSPTFVTSGIAVGLADLVLAALYFIWISRMVIKEEQLPRLNWLDLWIFGFIVAHLVSLPTSLSKDLTLFETIRATKFALLYFYVSRNLRLYQLKYVVAGVVFAMAIQASLGVVQHRTGRLMGIGRTKGAAIEYEQYTVSGFEAVRRAEGTTFDSHALGLFFAMTLPLPITLGVTRGLSGASQIAAAAGFGVGVTGLVISFSRAGWVSFAVAGLALVLCFVRWREWRLLATASAVGLILAIGFTLPFGKYVKQRLFEAPPELISARVETLEMASEIWKASPYTGVGANAYMSALEAKMGIVEGDPYFVPPHNMLLLLLTEMGPLGPFLFLGLTVTAAVRCWRVASHSRDSVLRAIGAALLAAIVALHVEGLTDPIYITGVTYYLFWFELGLVGAVYALSEFDTVPADNRVRSARLQPA